MCDINSVTPIINFNDVLSIDRLVNFYKTQTIFINEDYTDVPNSVTQYTPKIRKNDKLSKVMTIPSTIIRELWDNIKQTGMNIGPKIAKKASEMKDIVRGNYCVISNENTNEVLFVYSPVMEKNKLFAKHRDLFRYCFEVGIIPRENNSWRLWAVGEFSNTISPGKIIYNSFSGTYRDYIHFPRGSMKEKCIQKHYEAVSPILENVMGVPFEYTNSQIKYKQGSYEDIGIQYSILPRNLELFDTNVCYIYNTFTGFGENNMYNLFIQGKTFKDFIDENTKKGIKKENMDTLEFAELLKDISLLN